MEHKYARTNLWLEYIGDKNLFPCPFNLLPSYCRMKQLYTFIKNSNSTYKFQIKVSDLTLLPFVTDNIAWKKIEFWVFLVRIFRI